MCQPQPLAALAPESTTVAESAHLLEADGCVMLPHGLLDQLKELPAQVLKVYIYLRSLDHGEWFPATITTIVHATGRSARSVKKDLKILRETELIIRKAAKGNRPNMYSVPLTASRAGQKPSVVTASELAVPTATERELPVLPLVSGQPVTKAAEDGEALVADRIKSSLRELMAVCRRPANDLLKVLKIMIQEKAALPDTVLASEELAQAAKDGEAPVPAAINDPQPTTPPTPNSTLRELMAASCGPVNDAQLDTSP